MAMQYDPGVIEQFAEDLYAKARNVLITNVCIGYVLGALPGWFFSHSPYIGLLIGLGGAWLGYLRGQANGFVLKLQAQTALCQVQIERNTRARARKEPRDDPS